MMTKSAVKGRKPTSYISLQAARSLHHAGRACSVIATDRCRQRQHSPSVTTGIALNVFVTINYSLSESGKDNFDRLRNERFCRWLRTRSKQLSKSYRPYYEYVRENADGIKNVHWLVHIPEELYEEFCDLVPRWVTSLEDASKINRKAAKNHHQSPKDCVKVEKVRSSLAVRRYMLKGTHPDFARQFGILNPVAQGTIHEKRSGVSRTLSRAALKRLGYKSQRVPPPLVEQQITKRRAGGNSTSNFERT